MGVERQERLCRKAAKARGWRVAQVLKDNDLSASTGRRRPGYEQLKAGIADGSVQAVVVFDLDRLHRRPIELEEFMPLAEAHGVALATVSGDVDLSSPEGVFMARTMGNVAAIEVAKMTKRLRAKHAELAEQGQPVGLGAAHPFGYQRGGLEIDEAEAALLRQAAADVLAGIPLAAIARRWNEGGVLLCGFRGRPRWAGGPSRSRRC